MTTPRIRNLLRQADRVAKSGKRTAAEQLYREIIEEAPHVPEAWVGLSEVLTEEGDRRDALAEALALEPKHEGAQHALAVLNGEITVEEAVPELGLDPAPETSEVYQAEPEPEAAPVEVRPAVEIAPQAAAAEAVDEDQPLVCYRHPDTETSLRCNRCNRPICIKCANRTSVGYRCPECLREIEADFFTATTRDYVVASAVAFPLSLAAGIVVNFFGGGFGIFFYFIIAFVGSAIGSFIARLAHRAAGRRRGRYLPRVLAGIVALGGLLPALFRFLAVLVLGGGFGALFILLPAAIYSFVAASAAYYWLR